MFANNTGEKIMTTTTTPTQKQFDAIHSIIKNEMKGKAHIIIFDLLNEESITAFYQVRYNDRHSLAIDFKQWTVTEETHDRIYTDVKAFTHTMHDELMHTLCENEIIVKRMTIEPDGFICDD